MLNFIWSGLLLLSFAVGAFTGRLSDVTAAILKGGEDAVNLAISIAGVMALWSGVMKIAEKSHLTDAFAKVFMPLIRTLFPETAKDRETAGAIAMNITANFFGMGNAATPLGINAMKKLASYSKNAVATNSMCMLAVINSSSVQLIPSTLIAIRQSMGSQNPSEIMLPIWIASVITFLFGVILTKIMEGRR